MSIRYGRGLLLPDPLRNLDGDVPLDPFFNVEEIFTAVLQVLTNCLLIAVKEAD